MIKNIILDAGHGGLDTNGNYTTAPSKMFKFSDGEIAYEGVLNRKITQQVANLLGAHWDLNTIFTVRPDDSRDLSLAYRVQVANKQTPATTLFISIHCNAGGGTGFEIYTTKGTTKSDKLAEDIANEVESVYEEFNLRLRYDFSDGDKDKESDFYVLRKTKCPAVLLECGFFDNRKDYDLLKTEAFQNKLAHRIYLGILKYIWDEESN